MLLTAAVCALCLLTLVLILAGASKLEKKQDQEAWKTWMHPPDDDDGCSVLEEDDPDGKYTR